MQSKKKWSANFGVMNWHEAKKKCESVKMRLPTISELKDAFLDKEMANWNKDQEELLWSSDSLNDDESAKTITVREGYESIEWKVQPKNTAYPNMPPLKEITSVRCIQSNFKTKERKSGIVWSEYLGEMDWETAKKKCTELKMKLPTLKQFETAIRAREFGDKAEGSYWSGELSTNKKRSGYFIHWTNHHSFESEPTENMHVRCAK